MPNILAIETSGPRLSLAVKKGKAPLLQSTVPGFRHAENLLPTLDRLLKRIRITLKDIDLILINRGPGSFTGLRIGLATLKGFLACFWRPCFGALSLDVIAQNVCLPGQALLGVGIDAHREKVYSRLYQRRKDLWIARGRPEVLTVDQWIRKIPSGCFLAGDALERYEDPLKNTRSNKKINALPKRFWYPRAAALVSLYEGSAADGFLKLKPPKSQRMLSLHPLNTAADFTPLYLRLSEAEERRNEYAARRS